MNCKKKIKSISLTTSRGTSIRITHLKKNFLTSSDIKPLLNIIVSATPFKKMQDCYLSQRQICLSSKFIRMGSIDNVGKILEIKWNKAKTWLFENAVFIHFKIFQPNFSK